MTVESGDKKKVGFGALAARAAIALVLFYFVANALIGSMGGPQIPVVPMLFADESVDPPAGEVVKAPEAAANAEEAVATTDAETEAALAEAALLESLNDPHAMRSPEDALEALRTLRAVDGSEAGDDDLLVDFRLLNTTTLNPDPPPIFVQRLQRMDTGKVRIRGFMSPFDSLTDMRTFMLMPTPTGCFFCVPPSPKQVVLVRIKSDQKVGFIYDPIEVEGELDLWKAGSEDPAHQMFLYVMNDVKVKRLGKATD
jgi:hypothetical protein